MIFVDTSALLALRDRDDVKHAATRDAFERALRDGDELVTHNYVELETIAVAQRRWNVAAVRGMVDLLSPIEIRWIDRDLHASARAALLASTSKRVSFVDLISFGFMREHTITTALTIDRDFGAQGFALLP